MKNLLFKSLAPIMLYHGGYIVKPIDIDYRFHNVHPDNFYKQIKWLKKYFNFCHLEKNNIQNHSEGNIFLTFDDGYTSFFENIIPILEDLNVPSTVFINYSTILGHTNWRDLLRFIIKDKHLSQKFLKYINFQDKSIMFSSKNLYKNTKLNNVNSQFLHQNINKFLKLNNINIKDLNYCISSVKYLKKNKLIKFGNHSFNHYKLSSLNDYQQTREIEINHNYLMKHNVNLSNYFSLPFGEGYNQITLNTLMRLKYDGLLTCNKHFYKCNTKNISNKNFDVINRFSVSENLNDLKFQFLRMYLKQYLIRF